MQCPLRMNRSLFYLKVCWTKCFLCFLWVHRILQCTGAEGFLTVSYLLHTAQLLVHIKLPNFPNVLTVLGSSCLDSYSKLLNCSKAMLYLFVPYAEYTSNQLYSVRWVSPVVQGILDFSCILEQVLFLHSCQDVPTTIKWQLNVNLGQKDVLLLVYSWITKSSVPAVYGEKVTNSACGLTHLCHGCLRWWGERGGEMTLNIINVPVTASTCLLDRHRSSGRQAFFLARYILEERIWFSRL